MFLKINATSRLLRQRFSVILPVSCYVCRFSAKNEVAGKPVTSFIFPRKNYENLTKTRMTLSSRGKNPTLSAMRYLRKTEKNPHKSLTSAGFSFKLPMENRTVLHYEKITTQITTTQP